MIEKLIKIQNSDHKLFNELTNNLNNKDKWKEMDVDASEFEKNLNYHY